MSDERSSSGSGSTPRNISEGSVRKGGVSPKPPTPRPSYQPSGQGGSSADSNGKASSGSGSGTSGGESGKSSD